MSLSVVQYGNVNAIPPATLTFPQATTAGNCLVVVAGYQDQNGIATGGASQSFTLIYDANGGITGLHYRVWVAFGIAGGITSLSFSNGTGNGVQAAFLEISGVTAQDGANGSLGFTSFGSSLSLPAISTSAAGDMLVGVFFDNWHLDQWDSSSATNGFTLPGSPIAVGLSYLVGTSAGSYSTAASLLSASDTLGGFLFALTGSGGGGGSPSVTQRLALLGVGS